MEEMLVNLCRKQLVLSKYLSGFLLLISSVATSQSAFIRLSAEGFNGKVIQVSENQGIVHNFLHVSNFTFSSSGTISIHVQSQHWPAVRIISFGDAGIELTLAPNDTLELTWDKDKKDFKILRNTSLNEEVNQINSLVNQSIIDYTKKGPKSMNPAKMLAIADSLRSASSAEKNSYIANYQWFAAGDLQMISGRFSQIDLIRSVFSGRDVEPFHPAWRNTFHLVYENSMFNSVAKGNAVAVKSNLAQGRWSILYDWVASNSDLCDSLLCKWVTLKNCYDYSFQPGYNIVALYKVVNDGKSYYTYDSIMISEMNTILNYWKPRIKGNEFPNIEFKSLNARKLIHLSNFRGQPVYVAFLPDLSTSSLLIISQFKALQVKYGKEMRFLLFIPADNQSVSNLIKQYPMLEFADAASVDEKFSELFGRNDQPGYFMLNRRGETYQFPAEGPETDVENAFLGLIKE